MKIDLSKTASITPAALILALESRKASCNGQLVGELADAFLTISSGVCTFGELLEALAFAWAEAHEVAKAPEDVTLLNLALFTARVAQCLNSTETEH